MQADGDECTADENENIHSEESFEKNSRLDHVPGGGRRPKVKLDELLIEATALIMLVAGTDNEIEIKTRNNISSIYVYPGYDSTSQTMSFVAYYLATYPDIQRRLQAEIDAVFAGAGPDEALGYLDINGLSYLDMVVQETLRLHPPLAFLARACKKDYT